MAPPELTDDFVAEILLRLPPDDPSCAARASAPGAVFSPTPASSAATARSTTTDDERILCWASSTTSPTTPAAAFPDSRGSSRPPRSAPSNRSTRVGGPSTAATAALFQSSAVELTVWDPMTGDVWRQREPDDIICSFSTAAVLCAVPGCDHRDCHGGPFVLVFVGNDDDDGEETASASSYSSETRTWTAPSTVHHDDSLELESKLSVLAGDAVHFLTYFGKTILRYDLTKLELSVILPPAVYGDGDGDALLMTAAEDGELGLALFDGEASLHLWARVAGAADGDPGWVRRNVINLYTVLTFFDPVHSLSLVGFAEGTDIIFLHTDHGDYRMELKSLQINKLWEKARYFNVFPYMSFFVPGRDRTNCHRQQLQQ